MKFIATADLHIADYFQHNFSANFRLEQYLKLATQIKDCAIKNEAKFLIIAGDIFDETFARGMCIKYFYLFCEEVMNASADFKIYVIDGNHTSDTKHVWNQDLSVLPSICSRHYSGRIVYLDDCLEILEGASFYFKSWRPVFDLTNSPDGADFFIGHEYLNGATLKTGISIENDKKIPSKFKYAIVGDIHKAQNFKNVYIPGAPIQNSLKDQVDTSFLLVDFDEKEKTAKFENIPVTGMMRMYYTDQAEKYLPKQTFDVISDRTRIAKSGSTTRELSKAYDTKEILKELLKDNQSKDVIFDCLKSFENEDFDSSDFNISLMSLNVTNFKSIAQYYLDFSDLNRLTIVSGEVGAGKTSLFQAIIWILTGHCYKDKDDVIREGSNQVTGTLILESKGKVFEITRSHGAVKDLEIKIDSENLNGNTMSIRQTRLEAVLPIISKLHLFYFQQSRDGLLNELSDAGRVGLISELAGLSCVDKLTAEVVALSSKKELDLSKIGTNKLLLQSKIETLKNVLDNTNVKDTSLEIAEIEAILKEITDSESKFSTERDLKLKGIDIEEKNIVKDVETQFNEATQMEKELYSKIQDIKRKVESNNKIIESKKTWVCEYCQAVHTVEDITDEMRENASKDNEAKTAELTGLINLQTNLDAIKANVLVKKSELQDNFTKRKNQVIEYYNAELKKNSSIGIESSKLLGAYKEQLAQFEKYQVAKTTFSKLESDLKLEEVKFEALQATCTDIKSAIKTVFGRDGLLAAKILEKLAEKMNCSENIRINTCKTLKNGKVTPTLDIDLKVGKVWQPYRRLSGGQTLFADLHFLAQLINLMDGIGFLILDEVFKYFSDKVKDEAFKILENLNVKNTFAIVHGYIPKGDYLRLNVEMPENEENSTYTLR